MPAAESSRPRREDDALDAGVVDGAVAALEKLLDPTGAEHRDDLPRGEIHRIAHGARGRAGATLNTLVQPAPAWDAVGFGKETKGLSAEIRHNYHELCYTLPMENRHIRSLNLAMTAGIVLYEALRQQKNNSQKISYLRSASASERSPTGIVT